MKNATPSQRPGPLEMLTHIGRSFRLTGALMRDPRVSIFRKILFVLPLIVLIGALLLPETLIAETVANIIPFFGPVLALPPDAALDWVTAGLVALGLFRVFPSRSWRNTISGSSIPSRWSIAHARNSVARSLPIPMRAV